MSRRKRHAAEEDQSDIDLTPMLDVVFIMLIFFIVTASFIKESVVDLNVPEPNDAPPPENADPNILFSVTASNEVWLTDGTDFRRIDIRSVRANVERLHAEFPKASVIVKADVKSSAKTFVQIADAAREAKVYNVTLVKDEK